MPRNITAQIALLRGLSAFHANRHLVDHPRSQTAGQNKYADKPPFEQRNTSGQRRLRRLQEKNRVRDQS